MEQIADCIFCGLGKDNEFESQRKLFVEKDFYVILSVNPQTYGHTLVITGKHYRDLADLSENLLSRLFDKAVKMGQLTKEKLGAKAYVIKVNNQVFMLEGNKGHLEHIHIHVIPRYSANDKLADNPSQATLKDLDLVRKRILGES